MSALRFESVVVEQLRGIRKARVELGPHLNVLFGDNEVGKSTLAHALRVGLLLPVSSTEAESLVPWGGGEPEVALTLWRASDGRWVQIKKCFGQSPTAELLVSNTLQGGYGREESGRAVEDRVRAMLDWGIGGTGRKGQRGVPESFMSRVLLAEQTDVEEILAAQVEDESTQVRLRKALAAIAEDPRVKAVLNEAQSLRDRYFTATGKKRSGAKSPFEAVRTDLNRAEEDAEKEAERAAEAARTQAELGAAETSHAGAVQKVIEAEALHRAVLADVTRTEGVGAAEARVAAARVALEEIVAEIEALEALKLERAHATAEVEVKRSRATEAEAALALARDRRAAAERAKEAAASGGDPQVALELAQIEGTLAKLEGERDRQRARAAQAEEARAAAERARAAGAAADAAAGALEAARARLEAATLEVRRAEEAKRAAEAYRRFQDLDAAEQVARGAREAAHALGVLDAELAEAEVKLEALARERAAMTVPDDAELDRLRQIDRRLAAAREALELGLAVEVERHLPVGLHLEADGAPVEVGAGAFEAARQAVIRVGDLATVRVTVGRADARKKLRDAEQAAKFHLAPALAVAKATDLSALEALVRHARSLEAGRREAEQARSALIARRGDLARRAEEAPVAEARAAALRAELAGLDRSALGSPGSPEVLAAAVERAARALEASQGEGARAEAAAAQAVRSVEERGREAEAKAAELGGAPDVVLAASREALDRAEGEAAELVRRRAALHAGAAEAKQAAEAEAARAASELEAATARLAALRAASQEAERLASNLEGQILEKLRQVEVADRAGAEAALAAAEAALAACPRPAAPRTREELEAAEAALLEVRREAEAELRKVDGLRGVLERTGGLVAEARREDAEAAVTREKQRLEELELEAEAAKLLVEALNEARQSSTKHIGAQLAVPLAQRFAELTGRRYTRLEVSATLKTHGVEVLGQVRETDALSVGAREQLATLLRLLIAEQLGAPIVLDDHLVQADPSRLAWFRRTLEEVAAKTQVLVLTCRPQDYVSDLLPVGEAVADRAGGKIRLHDLGRLIERQAPAVVELAT